MKPKLTHIDAGNAPAMVDVSDKAVTRRTARAESRMRLPPEILAAFRDGDLVTKKGPVFHTAIIAGTQAVKKTADLIPFCHMLPVEHCRIEIGLQGDTLLLSCEVVTTARTGVEMEALTGVSIAALTVYDMTKALSHDIVIEEVRLVSKSGGKRDFSLTAGDYSS